MGNLGPIVGDFDRVPLSCINFAVDIYKESFHTENKENMEILGLSVGYP